jgi:hypothetical protein
MQLLQWILDDWMLLIIRMCLSLLISKQLFPCVILTGAIQVTLLSWPHMFILIKSNHEWPFPILLFDSAAQSLRTWMWSEHSLMIYEQSQLFVMIAYMSCARINSAVSMHIRSLFDRCFYYWQWFMRADTPLITETIDDSQSIDCLLALYLKIYTV